MRPEKANNTVQKAINRWLKGDKADLKKSLPAMRKLYKKAVKDEGDFRSGRETYGYIDQETIELNMEYISDRWRCAFRLRWLIDGVGGGYL